MTSAGDEWLIDSWCKSFPPSGAGLPASQIPEAKWRLHDDFTTPVAVLRETALAHNLARMREYCAENQVRISPQRWIAEHVRDHPDAEVFVFVDSLAAVELMRAVMRDVASPDRMRPLPVLVEVGVAGGEPAHATWTRRSRSGELLPRHPR